MQTDGFDLSLLGFDTTELESLLADTDEVSTGETEPDAVPDAPESPVSRPGEVYVLGGHRLMCGDSTSKEDTARLMGGGKAFLYLTDPPYNVALKGARG